MLCYTLAVLQKEAQPSKTKTFLTWDFVVFEFVHVAFFVFWLLVVYPQQADAGLDLLSSQKIKKRKQHASNSKNIKG